MSVMNAEMYDALIAAVAPDDKARAAAVVMSEDSLATKTDIASVKSDLHVLKWMTGLILVAIALPVFKIVILPILNSVF